MKTMILSAVMLVAATSVGAQARKPIYSFYDDGGEHVPVRCEVAKKLPFNVRRVSDPVIAKKGYLGTRQIEFADRNEAGIDAFEHFYSSKTVCAKALADYTASLEF
jgi:hypothetical protein